MLTAGTANGFTMTFQVPAAGFAAETNSFEEELVLDDFSTHVPVWQSNKNRSRSALESDGFPICTEISVEPAGTFSVNVWSGAPAPMFGRAPNALLSCVPTAPPVNEPKRFVKQNWLVYVVPIVAGSQLNSGCVPGQQGRLVHHGPGHPG